MSNRPKKAKIQYGEPSAHKGSGKGGGRTDKPTVAGGSDGGPMGAKIAIAAAVVVALIVIIVFAVQDGGGEGTNTTAFQPATVTGAALPAMTDGGSDPALGAPIPTITGKSFDGTTVEIKPGKPMVVAVLAHWCPHCQAEVPKIVEWQANGDLPKDVQVIGVSTRAEEARGNFPPASWLEREGWKNKVLADTPRDDVMTALGVTGFPTLVAIKADGTVALRGSGEMELAQVKDLFDAALGKTVEPTPGTNPLTSPVEDSDQ